MNTPIKWVAELAHVREVSLLGAADLNFWKKRLLNEDLLPVEGDGCAQVLISAADSKYMGVCFREMSFSVLVVRPEEGAWRDAAYLVRAFNSCRLFALVERVFFSTPYDYGDVRVSARLPVSIHLVRQGEVVFQAEMAADGPGPGREPSRGEEVGWEGPVFLPASRRGNGRRGKLFFARLKGHAQTYRFLPSQDSLAIRPSPDSDILQALEESHFVAKEWLIREDATHAKSKTYTRADVLPATRRVPRQRPNV